VTMRTMTDLIPSYLAWATAQGMSPRTTEQRDGILRRADAQIPYGLEEANEHEIVDWLNAPHARSRTGKRRSRATLSNYWYTLSSFYDWATGRELESNPMADLVPPKAMAGRSRGLSRTVVADVLDRAVEPWRTFVTLALYSGLRCGEIAGLDREDVSDTRIDVRDAKGGSPQVAFGHPEIWAAVKDLGPGNLAVQVGGVPDPSWVSIRSALYFRRQLGLVISLHRFRHTFACRLREQGADLFVIKKAMRHASVRSTEIYAEAGDGEVATAVASLPGPTRPAA
jgi:integrase